MRRDVLGFKEHDLEPLKALFAQRHIVAPEELLQNGGIIHFRVKKQLARDFLQRGTTAQNRVPVGDEVNVELPPCPSPSYTTKPEPAS